MPLSAQDIQQLDAIYSPQATSSLSQNDIAGLDSIYSPSTSSTPDFMDRESADLAKRRDNVTQITADNRSGKVSPLASGIMAAGQYAGAIGDIGANAVGSMARGARDLVTDPTALAGLPTEVGQAQQKEYGDIARQGKDYLLAPSTNPMAPSLGDAARFIGQKSGELQKDYPVTTGLIGAGANILSAIPAAKGIEGAIKGAGEVGADVLNGARQAIIPNQDFAKKLTMPIPTKKVAIDQVGRTTEQGLLNTAVVQPTSQEQAAIDAVKQVPGVSPTKSYQGNYNLIKNANINEAQKLTQILKNHPGTIDDGTILQKFANVEDGLKNNMYVSGDGQAAVKKLLDGAYQKIESNRLGNNPLTAGQMLQARKQFDYWVEAQKGSKIFNPNIDGPVSDAVQKVRQSMNQMIGQAAPDANVQSSLAKQSAYYTAMDNIADKAAKEGNNSITRAYQKIAPVLKNPVVRTAALISGIKE